jgi:hypothetical protein
MAGQESRMQQGAREGQDAVRRWAEGLAAIRLRTCINTQLDDHGLTTPARIGAVIALPTAEAVALLTRKQ